MKNEEMNYDDLIGSMKSREITKKQHDNIRAARKAAFEKRLDKDKIEDILVGFRFSIRRQAINELHEENETFGRYISELLEQMNIKRSAFANYISISPRNINKYLNGERKFNIEQALMLEKIFKVSAKTILQAQLNIEIANARKKTKADDLNLNDLLNAS
jgi:addiction module HigA family antidote